MKTYTLEQVLSKLIKRKYIKNQTKIKVEVGDKTLEASKASLYHDKSILLQTPVTDVYVSMGYSNDKKRFLDITDSGIKYKFTIAKLEKVVNEIFENKLEDICSGYILTFVCRKLPDVYLNSFLYKEGLMHPDIYSALVQYKNTIMNYYHYSKCLHYINKHRNALNKQYGFKTEPAGNEPKTADKMLADVLSIIVGFKVLLRDDEDGTYIIEAVDLHR